MSNRRMLSGIVILSGVTFVLGCTSPGSRSGTPGLEQVSGHVHNGAEHIVALAPDTCPICNIYEVNQQGVVRIRNESGQGTGIVIDSGGHIITNAHVVGDSETVLVETSEGTLMPGAVVRRDTVSDLALIIVHNRDVKWKVIDRTMPSQDRIGSAIYVIGHPLGLGWTVTQGVLSGKREGGDVAPIPLFQTDAGISPGNSGGPVFDAQGRFVGLIRSKAVAPGAENIAFAIPASVVADFIDHISENEVPENKVSVDKMSGH